MKNIIAKFNIDEMSPSKTVCFTGHRPKYFHSEPYSNAAKPVYENVKNEIKAIVSDLYKNKGIRYCISGGAQGFDMLAYMAVAEMKAENYAIKNIVCIPFKGQELRWAKYGLFSQRTYHEMLESADAVIVCDNNLSPASADWKEIVKALFMRNDCMIEYSKYVVGCFENNSWVNPATKSGTAGCLRNALKSDRELIVRPFI